MTTLDLTLRHLGFASRPQQQQLYDELLRADEDGVLVQAGTGTGKSLAVLAAAVDWHRRTGLATIVATPTKVLMDQYTDKDAPAVQAATGANIVALKGRRNYLCTATPAMKNPRDEHEKHWEKTYRHDLYSSQIIDGVGSRFGCPGSKKHKDDTICHATFAREAAMEADVVVTNLHVLILDCQIKDQDPEATGLLPEYGALFVDEAHHFEETMRGFSTTSISTSALERLVGDEGRELRDILETMDLDGRGARAVPATRGLAQAVAAITHAREIVPDDADEDEPSVAGSARTILNQGVSRVFDTGNAVLHFEPSADRDGRRTPAKLVSSWINLGGACSRILTRTPVGMVSATIPRTMARSIGLPGARFVDVGHPFDYARQGKIGFSNASGAWKAAQQIDNVKQRAAELLAAIRATQGGCLLLFSAMRDLRAVEALIGDDLRRDGRLVLIQHPTQDKRWMAEQFKKDGRAVLFGSESFATGFDVPGKALELVAIWKLPYPGLDPVTRAISDSNRQRYEDMMMMKVAQAAGRLIRTHDDVGRVFIADSRGRSKLLSKTDPMVRHLAQFEVMA